MTASLRETGRELVAIAAEAREIAARIDAPIGDRWAIARDLRMTAFTIERQAAFCEKRGAELGEPEPTSPDPSLRILAAYDRLTTEHSRSAT